jgi:serine/threonine protein kinase
MLLASGARLGIYEILAPLGQGGMGEVYRARDPKLQRDVAIKLLTGASNTDAVERFQREARAIAALNHPNIVTVYGVEEEDARPYLVMELVDGERLADAIRSNGLAFDRVLAFAIPLADALSAAHAQGITHRDLKPANVMVTKDGRVKVLDFGLAKLREDAVRIDSSATTRGLTGHGEIVGTVAYMSPEQACGTPTDPRTDIFSAGVMLYEMATGRRPFAGDSSVALIAAILKEQPQPLLELRPDLPHEFSRIVRRALAKDPEQRYQTAKDLRNDLQGLKDDLTSGALTAPAVLPKKRSTVGMLAAGAAAVIVATGVYVIVRNGALGSRSPAEDVSVIRLTSTGKASFAAISPDGKYVVHVASDNSLWLRQTAATGSSTQILPPGLSRYIGLTFSPDGNYVYFTREDGLLTFSAFRIGTLGNQSPQPIIHDVDSAVAMSPDGSRLAFIRVSPGAGKTRILVAGADGSAPAVVATRDLASGFPIDSGLAWSPDSRRLVVPVGGFSELGGVGTARLEIIDVGSKSERPLTAPQWESVGAVAWLPGGGIVVSATEVGKPNEQLWRVSESDGTVTRLTNDLISYSGVSASIASASIVTVQGDKSSILSAGDPRKPDSFKPVTAGLGRYDGQRGLTWMADGKLLYSSAASGQFHLWESEADGSQARQITTAPAIEEQPSGCPDNSLIFIETVGGLRSGLARLNTTTGRVTPLTHDSTDYAPHCLPEGATLVFSRMTSTGPRFHRMAFDGTGLTVLKPTVGYAISPDGRLASGIARLPPNPSYVVAVVPIDGPGLERGFDIVSLPPMIQFTAGGDALTFLESRKGPPALWTQPLKGGSPTLLLDLHGDRIFNFAWSRSGQLVVAHGPALTDVVLMSGVR